MNFIKTEIDGVFIIEPKIFEDARGYFFESYSKAAFDAAGLPLLGVVPEDAHVALAAGSGQPLVLASRKGAAMACLNIAKRIQGQRVPLMKIHTY